MRNRKIRRFRHRSNGRGYQSRNNNGDHMGLASNSFSNGTSRNNFKPQQSAEKLADKYSTLGKEALTSGDRILSENYFQHADHFMRILSERKFNQNKIKTETIKSDIQSSEKEDVKTNQNTTEKKE